MKPPCILVIALAVSLAACATTPRDDSAYLTRILVGSWVEEDDDPECPSTALYKFRDDGKYTVTHESCDLISDGFGRFHFGWYIAKNHLCLVDVEEEFADEVKRPGLYRERFREQLRRGFVEEHCSTRIEDVTARTVRLVPRSPDARPTLMRRQRW